MQDLWSEPTRRLTLICEKKTVFQIQAKIWELVVWLDNNFSWAMPGKQVQGQFSQPPFNWTLTSAKVLTCNREPASTTCIQEMRSRAGDPSPHLSVSLSLSLPLLLSVSVSPVCLCLSCLSIISIPPPYFQIGFQQLSELSFSFIRCLNKPNSICQGSSVFTMTSFCVERQFICLGSICV